MWHRRAETPVDRETKAALWFDFWSSYKYSQADPILQRYLLRGLEASQRLTWPEAMLERREAVMPQVQKGLRRQAMPRGHSTAREPNLTVKKEYALRWKTYADMVQTPTPAAKLSPEYKTIVRSIIFDSASADRSFLGRDEGRSSKFFKDPFTSYTREYIVRGEDTHSVACNYLFGLAHQMLHQQLEHPTEYVMRNEMLALASGWETLHPGQEFWVPATGGNPFVVVPITETRAA